MSLDTVYQHYFSHPRTQWPLGFRVRKTMSELDITDFLIYLVRVNWLFPEVESWTCIENRNESLPPPMAHSLLLEHASCHSESLHVYTNCWNSGFAVVFPDFYFVASDFLQLHKFLLPSSWLLCHQSVFSFPQQPFTINSDSHSALQALGKFNSSHPMVLAILEWLFLLKRRGCGVSLCWVLAHLRIEWNEQTDTMVKAAACSLQCSVSCPPPSFTRSNSNANCLFPWDMVVLYKIHKNIKSN